MYCIVIQVISASRWFVWEVLIQYYVQRWEEKNIRASSKTVCEHESKDSICVCRCVIWVLLHFTCTLNELFLPHRLIVALAIRELLSASAVKVFTIMICAHGFVSCLPAQSHVCWRLLSMICRHKRCRPVWAKCCNTIDSSLLKRARKCPLTIIGSGED